MNIVFKDKKFEKICNDFSLLTKRYGDLAKRISHRLIEIRAAKNLSEMQAPTLGRCHELKGSSKGIFSIDIDKKFRLLLSPNYPVEKMPLNVNGSIDIKRVEDVIILEVKDTHEKQ